MLKLPIRLVMSLDPVLDLMLETEMEEEAMVEIPFPISALEVLGGRASFRTL